MRKLAFFSLCSSLLLTLPSLAQKPAPQLGKAPTSAIIAAMTLEEKGKLVVGMGMVFPGVPDNAPGMPPVDPDSKIYPEKVPGAAGRTHPIPRLGIPSISVADGPAGIRIEPYRNNDSSRTYYATAWPVATLLASSFDTALVRQVGRAFGNEVLQYGADVLLGPAMNIHRNPLGGRNFEYYSEDPLVAGYMAAAMVQGIQSNGVGTSVKHFAANNQETDRNTINTIVSQRALREIYLKGFGIVVRNANPWTIMSSYNKINGVYTSQQPDLLTTILRDEWKFKGLVMSDWFGGNDPIAQMHAGNDLIMPGSPDQSRQIVDAVNNGRLDIKDLDRNVDKILQIILRSPEFKKYKASGRPDLTAHAKIARQAASESMVLLKNDNHTLPLTGIKKIALFGNYSYDLIAGGTGSGDVNKAYTVSLAQGLATAGYLLEQDLKNEYSDYITKTKAGQPKGIETLLNPPTPPAEMDISPDRIDRAAQVDDIAILTIGKNAGEGRDRKVEDDYYLPEKEKQGCRLIADAFHAKGKKLIVVLNIGGVINMADWRDLADGILLAWQPGMEGGNAISDILSGKKNPSGHLATTFPMNYKDVPSAANFPGREFKDQETKGFFGMPMIPAEVKYEEGIYTGYRYYTSSGVKTAYPFGFGLSYTNFGYTNLKIEHLSASGSIPLSITVTNTGAVPGKEVVQIYISAPKGALDKPAEELKAFAKTGLLQPGQSQTLHFSLSPSDLASFDTPASAWIADKGEYTVKAGASSEDIRLTGHFTLPAKIVTEKVHPVLAP